MIMNIRDKLYTSLNHSKRLLTGQQLKTQFFRYLKSIERLPAEQLLDLQKENLYHLLKYSFSNIEAYRKYENQINLEKKTIFDEIRYIEPLLKNDVINRPSSFINPKLKNAVKYKSGGTSSNLAVFHKGMSEELMNADEYFNDMNNIYSGKTRIILKRHQNTYLFGNDYEPETIFQPLRNTYFFDVKYLNEQKMNLAYEICRKKSPSVMIGLTRPVYDFARFIEESSKEVTSFEVIMSGGSTMLPTYREKIEKVFNAPLINYYGSTDCGNVASQCKKREGLHTVPVLHYIEILDKDQKQVKEGETGEMYITLLNSRVFPMIRYKTNDYAVYTEKRCSCGRTFPAIGHVIGRSMESLRSPGHDFMTPMGVDRILSKYPRVVEFQAFQDEDFSISLNLEMAGSDLTESEKNEIRIAISSHLGFKAEIRINKVNNIPALFNGKILHIISKV